MKLFVKDLRALRMVFPKQSRPLAFQSAKRGWAEPDREAFVWHARHRSEDLGRNRPRTAGRLSQKNAFVDLCDFMRLCSQGCTKTRFMSEKLTLILTTYCSF